MSSPETRYPASGSGGGRDSPPIVTPHYGSSLPKASDDIENARKTRCVTGVRFIMSIHGILNVVIFIALICVIITAGVVDTDATKDTDELGRYSKVKVSAFHTRNAVLAFAVIGFILIIVDTILHMTRLINRLPAIFDLIFIIIMLVMAAIFLILACCAAAWQHKMSGNLGSERAYKGRGGAGAASFFLFVATFATAADFILRLLRSKGPDLR